MEILSNYVVAITMAICLAIGYLIKHSLNFIPNKYIPLILAIAEMMVLNFDASNMMSIVLGVFCT